MHRAVVAVSTIHNLHVCMVRECYPRIFGRTISPVHSSLIRWARYWRFLDISIRITSIVFGHFFLISVRKPSKDLLFVHHHPKSAIRWHKQELIKVSRIKLYWPKLWVIIRSSINIGSNKLICAWVPSCPLWRMPNSLKSIMGAHHGALHNHL